MNRSDGVITYELIISCDLPANFPSTNGFHLSTKIIYPSICMIGFVFYATVIAPIVMGRFHKKYTNSFYLFVIGIAACELISLSSDFYIGLCQWIGKCPGHPTSVMWNLCWWQYYVNCFLHAFTALNRFCCVIFFQKHKTLFQTKQMIAYFMFAIGAGALTNFYGFKYGLKYCSNFGYSWFDDDVLSPADQDRFFWIDTITSFVCYGLVLALYAIAFIFMRFTKAAITAAASNGASIEKKERRLLYQGCLITAPTLLYVSSYQIGNNVPNLTAAMGIVYQVLSIVRLTINPAIYLWFNKDLRKDVRNMFICTVKNEVVPSEVRAKTCVHEEKNQTVEMKLVAAPTLHNPVE